MSMFSIDSLECVVMTGLESIDTLLYLRPPLGRYPVRVPALVGVY